MKRRLEFIAKPAATKKNKSNKPKFKTNERKYLMPKQTTKVEEIDHLKRLRRYLSRVCAACQGCSYP